MKRSTFAGRFVVLTLALAIGMASPTSACNACHQGIAAGDWVFTQYYPVLRAAQKASWR